MKSGGAFYQTSRISFTDLKFAIERDEKESQCPYNRDPVEVPPEHVQFPVNRLTVN
jgi:hypothetical protein